MDIKIGYDFEKGNFIKNEPLALNKKETQILNKIAADLKLDGYNIVHNTTDYSTLQYKGRDTIRLKYGDNSKWISICIPIKTKKDYINSPLFAEHKNKNQLLWKSKIHNDDFKIYYDIIKARCDEIDNEQ